MDSPRQVLVLRNRATLVCVAGAALALVLAAPAGAETTAALASSVAGDVATADLPRPPAPTTRPTTLHPDPPPAPPVVRTPTRPPVHFAVRTRDPVFFITVDDGAVHDAALARYVARTHVPITVFLANAAVKGDPGYFRRVAAYGSVQNHTMTHQDLSLRRTDRHYQICHAQSALRHYYGVTPWLLRPPYGGGWMPVRNPQLIQDVAASCGIRHVVLWNVSVQDSGRISFNATHFHRGDIVLLHFTRNVARNVALVVRLYAARGLHPADLGRYLR